MTFSEKIDLRLLLSFSFASSDVTNLGVIRDRNLDVNRSVMSYVCAGIFINTDVKFCWIWYPAYNTLQIKYKSHECAGVYIRCHLFWSWLPWWFACKFGNTSLLNQFKIRWILWNRTFVNEKREQLPKFKKHFNLHL